MPDCDARYRQLNDLPKRLRRRLEGFFLAANQTSKKVIAIGGWEGPKAARLAIERAAAAFRKREA
jgi:inorganic pyrophosphatase